MRKRVSCWAKQINFPPPSHALLFLDLAVNKEIVIAFGSILRHISILLSKGDIFIPGKKKKGEF